MPTIDQLKKRHMEEDAEARARFLHAAFQHFEGRKYFWNLLAQCGVLGGTPFSINAEVMSFNCGKMEIGNAILLDILNTVGEEFADTMKEMNNVRRHREHELAAADPDPNTDWRAGGTIRTDDDTE